MIEDHICDGDYVLVQRGDRGAGRRHCGGAGGRIGDDAQADLSEPGDRVRLQPANASMQPILVPAELCQHSRQNPRSAAEILSGGITPECRFSTGRTPCLAEINPMLAPVVMRLGWTGRAVHVHP